MDRGPVVIRRRLGSALKQLRVNKNLQLEHVAKVLEVSPAKLSRLETGQVAPKTRDVRDLLEEYDAPADVREQIMVWADGAKERGWWEPVNAAPAGDLNLFISLEAEAKALKVYSICIPGLLQTREYASMVIAGMAPHNTREQHERLVDIRLQRQAVLCDVRGDVEPLRLQVILDEAALYRGPAGGDVMKHQIEDLIKRSKLGNVEIRIFPFAAGYGEAISMFSIFESRSGDAPVVCVESTGADNYYDTARERAKYEAIWNAMWARAAGPDESVELMWPSLKRWTNAQTE
jgi:transcriptional regulator with XRE-family HTH domain